MVIGSTGAWKGPFGYSGSAGYQEDETGLQLLGHRYYDSSTGRFITRDPIKDGRNWYAYCDNNPVSRVDAEGLGWHNPSQVWVDPKFSGEVWVVGEPDESWGDKQALTRVMPGQISHPKMDVDLVYVIMPNGTKKCWFIMGRGYTKNFKAFWGAVLSTGSLDQGGIAAYEEERSNEYYWVDAQGDLHSSDPGLTIIPFEPGSNMGGSGRWDGDTKKAKRNPFPSDRKPFASARPPWVRA